ncbi:HDOD domain-containing protein [Paucidesulfovibrio longus]|uniref:HDOD domain-containing protein n=1 Tax=Paucidesulfovibrio longus TaxID=889 RepID=UPI0003B6212C|nr:HDOD domain-containing protein [Paucidesulfovibrio longus]
MSRREEIIARIKDVKRMPSAVQKAVVLLGDPDVDVGELSRIIEHDPGLTSNVLRLANSAYFGGSRSIASVRDAIVRLGAGNLKKMLATAGLEPVANQEIKGYGLPPGMLLKHSITVAVSAEELAKQLGRRAPEHTFTAGLLSDIGKVVLGTFLAVDAEPILALAHDQGLTFERAEEEILGINHAEVGALLLDYWELPENIVQVVRWKYDPLGFDGSDLALDLVHVADALAKMSGIGVGVDGLNYRPSDQVVKRLELTSEIIDRTMAEVLDKVEQVFEGLGGA